MWHVLDARPADRALAVAALTGLLAVIVATLGASSAHAGFWMQTSCINPDQSAAPSDGWSSFKTGTPPIGSTNNTNCGPGRPMSAFLSMQSPAPSGAAEVLQYTPPDGSRLVGGSLLVGLSADGYGYRAAATAAIFTPAYAYDAANVFLQCVALLAACQNGLPSYYGMVELQREGGGNLDRGGNLYLGAGCLGQVAGTYCTHGGSRGAWSVVAVAYANLLLSSAAAPTAADFEGSLLDPGAHGPADLSFTAADDGPGVYRIIVTIDGKEVYAATPNTNSGKCAPVGTGPAGALMFDSQQPCPRSQAVDLTIPTTTLADGPHELEVTVLNAAGDASTVLRRTITTNNRTAVSSRLTTSKSPTTGAGAPTPVYAVVLDPPTRALLRGVRRGWTRSALTLSGTLRNSSGAPAQGVLVTVFARNAGRALTRALARTTTDAAGHWVLTAPRGPSRLLTISYGERPDPGSKHAIKIRQAVSPTVTLRARAEGGGWLRFDGRVHIKPLGNPAPYVVLQSRGDEGWARVEGATRVRRSGAFGFRVSAAADSLGGTYPFRVVAEATPHFARGVSPTRMVEVR